MPIYQERVRDVARDHGHLVDVQLCNVLNNMDSSALRRVCWLDDPGVTLWLGHFQSLVVSVEVMKLVWQDVGVGDEVKLLSAIPFLHLDVVVTKTVFARDLVTLWEVVHSLVLIQPLVEVAFAGASCPQQVPFVRLRCSELVCLEDRPNKFGLALEDFVEHLLVVNVMVPALTSHYDGAFLNLMLGDWLDV